MLGHHAIGERVLELLEGIDLERPPADEEMVAAGLQAYVQALGLPKPNVRIAPDVRALRMSRVYPAQDRGAWQAFTGRQWRLLDEGVSGGWRLGPSGWRAFSPPMEAPRAELDRLVRSDRAALDVGLGSSRYVRGVRHVTQSLDLIARALTSMVMPPKRVDALVPLAEAAAAGLFAYAVGMRCTGDLVALIRPRMRFDEEGRLHHWDGSPAVEWPNGRGLYF